jgi:hypothetical protein
MPASAKPRLPWLAQARGAEFGLKPALSGKTTLEDGHYQYAVKAGTSIEDGIVVVNFSDKPITLRLYAADVVTPRGGGVAPVDPGQRMKSVGAWVQLERSDVEVPGKDQVFVGFAVRVPDALSPGDHLGAIVASRDGEPTPGGISVEQRVALITRVRIPGTPSLKTEIGPVHVASRGRSRIFRVELRNVGNLLFTAKGTVDVTEGGERVASIPLTPSEVYLIPKGKSTFIARWDDPPLFGSRRAVASFDTRAAGVPFRRISSMPVAVKLVSWLWLIMIACVFIGIGALIALTRLRPRPRRMATTAYQARGRERSLT